MKAKCSLPMYSRPNNILPLATAKLTKLQLDLLAKVVVASSFPTITVLSNKLSTHTTCFAGSQFFRRNRDVVRKKTDLDLTEFAM